MEAWGPALDYWTDLGLPAIAAYERGLYARSRLAEVPLVRVLGQPTDRISIVSFTVEGLDATVVAKALDQEGIAVRAGSLEAQPFLAALGVENAVRASFVLYNTKEEADFLVRTLRRIADRISGNREVRCDPAGRRPASREGPVNSAHGRLV